MTFHKFAFSALLLIFCLFSQDVLSNPNPSKVYRYQVTRIYDGDTFFIVMDGLPPELAEIGVRVRGIDTPELRGKCDSERQRAKAATQFTYNLIKTHDRVVYLTNLQWDKFGGRVDADVLIGEARIPLASMLVQYGHARPYLGGKRAGWCQ